MDGAEHIGYCLTVAMDADFKNSIWKASNDKKVVEIENIALFPSEEGKKRGGLFLEMIFRILFAKYDTVYLSSSSTNYHSIPAFYKRMGMTLIKREHVEDFRESLIETA